MRHLRDLGAADMPPLRRPESVMQRTIRLKRTKKAGVAAPAKVIDHAGLFTDGPPGLAELPFI